MSAMKVWTRLLELADEIDDLVVGEDDETTRALIAAHKSVSDAAKAIATHLDLPKEYR